MFRLSVIMFFLASTAFAQKEIKTLSAADFKSALETSENAVLIDLRTVDEMKKGVIANAVHLDYFRDDFAEQLKKLDRSKTYFLYCAVGGRSQEAMEMMADFGFTRVYHLKNGIHSWKQQKFPLVTPK